jgi:signal transduction histidine kinase
MTSGPPCTDDWDTLRPEVERFVLEETGELTLLLDPERMVVLSARGPTERILGRPPRALEGLAVSELRPADGERRPGTRLGPEVLREPGFFGEVALRHADGSTCLTSLRVRPFALPDGAQRVLLRVIDASEQVALALELQRAHAALQEAFGQLGEHERALAESRRAASLSHFAAALSHELNNALAPIGAGLKEMELCLADVRGAWPAGRPQPLAFGEMSEIGQDVVKTVARVATIASRLAELEIPVRAKRFLLSAELQMSAPGEAILAPEKLEMDSDPAALSRLLAKLLSNAHLAQGPAPVAIRAEEIDGQVRLSVEDQGPGVPPSVREHIFDPFFTTRPPGQGLGLGLFLARRAAHVLGGDLVLADSPRGALFVATLPVKMPLESTGVGRNYEELRVRGR